MIIINLKTYKQGGEVLKLVRQIERINKKAIVCVQPTDLANISKKTKLKVYAQNVTPLASGKGTGHVIPEAIKVAGARGTLLNHSEYPLHLKDIKEAIRICKQKNLKVICCVSRLRFVKNIIKYKPDAIAFEDSTLIGTGKSITQYNPRRIKKFVSIMSDSNIPAICGAGISSKKDIKAAQDLGCQGVLISSAIAKKGKVEILK